MADKGGADKNGSELDDTAHMTSNGRQEQMRRNFKHDAGPQRESTVKVIYTGGTIGMVRNEKNVLAPHPNALEATIRKYPNMHNEEYAQKRYGASAKTSPLVLPDVKGMMAVVLYEIFEYQPLLDSSNMTVDDWIRIGEDIYNSYEHFDAFVILHGTDTLSFTASALSYMLENLGKTVIITGSQIPIFETRSDGKDNFVLSLIIAGNYVIPEVCVLFSNKLMRGNRTTKVSCDDLDAFRSPNVKPIAQCGINIEVDYLQIFRPCKISRFVVNSNMDLNVALLRIFPSITCATVRAFMSPPMKGVVLQSFGSGNVPSNRQDLLDELKAATDRGVIIVNITQCLNGSVSPIYDTGAVLGEVGVIPGYDMTPEAAITKLSYVIGKSEWTLEYKKKIMKINIRGEMTQPSSSTEESGNEFELVQAVARCLRLSSPQAVTELGETLYPAMLGAAVMSGDINKIKALKLSGVDPSGVNHEHRTALHTASYEGNYEVVSYLLKNGASLHIRDSHDRTPLMDAIYNDNHKIIRLLISCGAHLPGSKKLIGEDICTSVARGSLDRVKSYRMAGADLSHPDLSGRTPLHVAALHGFTDIVEYLLEIVKDVDFKDMLNLTAYDYAKQANHNDIAELIAAKSKSDPSESHNSTWLPKLS